LADDLRDEAIRFGRYLVGEVPGKELIDRYCRANTELFGEPDPEDRRLLELARRHPRTIAMLDAGTGLAAPQSLFRKKLLVMMAILETTPAYAARTEQRSVGLPELVVRVGLAGARTVVNVAGGLVLVAVTRRA
jgi:hypothetical protein